MIKFKNISYTVLAVIPARGGSKGIKLKNLKKINGITLVSHAINIAKELKFIDDIIVSTDHNKIKKEAEKSGIQVPFLRSKKLSGDIISDSDVLFECLSKAEKFYNKKFDLIIMLQPTSPNRKVNEIKNAFRRFLKFSYNALWSISIGDNKYHPLKVIENKNNKINLYKKSGKKIIARQQLEKFYIRNGLFYIFRRKNIINKIIIDSNSGGYIINRVVANIDDLSDLKKAKFIMDNEKNS